MPSSTKIKKTADVQPSIVNRVPGAITYWRYSLLAFLALLFVLLVVVRL